jgi:hypothetical protein
MISLSFRCTLQPQRFHGAFVVNSRLEVKFLDSLKRGVTNHMHQSLCNFKHETTRTLRCWKAVKPGAQARRATSRDDSAVRAAERANKGGTREASLLAVGEVRELRNGL